MKTWQTFGEAEREFQYNPRQSVPDFERFQTTRSALAKLCRAAMTAHLDVRYGDGALQGLDIFTADPASPVLIFFHGGYWRAQDKENFAFVARDLVPAGVTVVVANYDLCPAVTLDAVSGSALDAIAWCYRNIAEFGGDPNGIAICGISAGAHLCSMALATDWRTRGLPANPFRGAVLISGIFDPEPARHTSVNAELNLDDATIARNDTLSLRPLVECPTWIFAGGQEPWAWVEQSFDYSTHLRRHGRDPEVHVLPGYHHFNIMDDFLSAAGPIATAVRRASGKT